MLIPQLPTSTSASAITVAPSPESTLPAKLRPLAGGFLRLTELGADRRLLRGLLARRALTDSHVDRTMRLECRQRCGNPLVD